MTKTMGKMEEGCCSTGLDMQVIGNFLSFASRGDRVGLNQMLRQGTPPNVQDYDKRTALHLAASEGHAPIVELLLHYKADVNLIDRWQRTPLTDARLYGHRDICRILEVNGGKDFINDQPMTVRHEQDSSAAKFDIKELDTQHSSTVKQGVFGESQRVKWRGTWVVKTVIKCDKDDHPAQTMLSAKVNTLLQELRHPNILQFLGSIVCGEEIILITEYLPKGSLDYILSKKVRLELHIALRYALDIARGMNYLHQHKPSPIVHNYLNTKNLLQDEGDQWKIGEYWLQILYKQRHPNQDKRVYHYPNVNSILSTMVFNLMNIFCITGQRNDNSSIPINLSDDTKKDIHSFGCILYQMLEGNHEETNTISEFMHFEPKFQLSRCPKRIQELIQYCTSKDPSERPSFAAVIEILEEVSAGVGKPACPVC